MADEQHSSDTPSTESPAESAPASLKRWLRSLTRGDGGFDSTELLHFTPTAKTAIDLTEAHPSGLIQLLSGRRTRLSTMLRDRGSFDEAMKAGRGIRSRIFDVGQERGIDAGFLTTGMAYWRYTSSGGRATSIAAPVLLSPIRLTIHPGHNEYEIQLAGPARLNPVLLRHLSQDHGIDLDRAAIEASAYGTARLNPLPVLDALRHATEHLSDARVVQEVYVGTFVRLLDPSDDPRVCAEHPIIRDLSAPRTEDAGVPRFADGAPASPDDLHPSEEFLVLDADASQHAVIDRAESGESFVVSAPPGTGQTQTAINVAARLAYRGRRVAVVAERRASIKQFQQTLAELGLESMVRCVDADASSDDVRRHAIAAVARNERAEKLDLTELHRLLTRRRELLQENMRSLHEERSQWGSSTHEAMQALAALTAQTPPPTTEVRLPPSVLVRLKDRSAVTAKLRRYAELGGLDPALETNAWHGAKITSTESTVQALSQATSLRDSLPALTQRMEELAQSTGMRAGETLDEWAEQLDVLDAVGDSLKRFAPDIFDREVVDLLAATASGAWRREHGIQMGAFTRSRLRRVAKELILPDVYIEDLNEALTQVNAQYGAWKKYARPGSLPSPAGDLTQLRHRVSQLRKDAQGLAVHAQGTAFPGSPTSFPAAELFTWVERLVSDRSALKTMPERTQHEDQLRVLGLQPLLDDLTRRGLTEHEVGAELELSWWTSVFENMVAEDPNLTRFDANSLFTLESEYRAADREHIASGPARLIEAVGERWRRAVVSRKPASASLRALLLDGDVSLRNLAQEDRELVTHMHPLWLGSVHTLPMLLGEAFSADAVIVLDAHSLNTAQALSAVARAQQVIAFGDPMLPGPRSFASAGAAESSAESSALSLYASLAEIRPTMALEHLYRCVDSTLAARLSQEFYGGQVDVLPRGDALAAGLRRVRVEYIVDGYGPQTARTVEIESVQAEVSRCVDLVFDHIRSTPHLSLAVITASSRHAARVAEAVRVRMAQEPWSADFFRTSTEPFLILPLERASGHVRDHIVFSIGYGRSSGGDAAVSFGPLSEPGGRELFTVAMTRARRAMHVLSCFTTKDIDEKALGYGALDLYEFLRAETTGTPAAAADSPPSPLLNDLSVRLRGRGLRVRENVEGVIDIAAFEQGVSGRDRAPVAVLSDSSRLSQETGVRERVRLRPERLERFGWTPLTAWSVEVFLDPDEAAERVMAAMGLAPVISATTIPAEEETTEESGEHPDAVFSGESARVEPSA